MGRVFFFCLLFIGFSSLCQEILVIDSENNPISNVSAFNQSKTKSVLSNSSGVINLSRFLPEEMIFFQHPGYKVENLKKESISQFLVLTFKYNPLLDIKIYETKNSNNIRNVAEKKIHITKSEISEISGVSTADILEKKGGVSVQKSQMGGGGVLIFVVSKQTRFY